MKIAIFSDVHANLPALERFIEVTQNIVDGYISLGDIVNYGPWNNECLEVIHQLPNVTLLEGNHERLFNGAESIEHELPLVQQFFFHSIKSFSKRTLINSLNPSCKCGKYQCVHTIGHRSIYSNTDIQIENNIILGHTHHQYCIERSGFVIVNPGSVGQNRKWIDTVDYAIIDTRSNEIELLSTQYNFNFLISELRSRKYPQICIDYYLGKPKKY